MGKIGIFNKSDSRSAAFTLIEVLVVTAILGVVTAIAVPTVNAVKKNSRNNADSAALKTLNEAATRIRLDGISSAGTTGSNKEAALEYYTDSHYVSEAPPPDITRLLFLAGIWSKDMFASGENAELLQSLKAGVLNAGPTEAQVDAAINNYIAGDFNGDGLINDDDFVYALTQWYGVDPSTIPAGHGYPTYLSLIGIAPDATLADKLAYMANNWMYIQDETGNWVKPDDMATSKLLQLDDATLQAFLAHSNLGELGFTASQLANAASLYITPAKLAAIQGKLLADAANGVSYNGPGGTQEAATDTAFNLAMNALNSTDPYNENTPDLIHSLDYSSYDLTGRTAYFNSGINLAGTFTTAQLNQLSSIGIGDSTGMDFAGINFAGKVVTETTFVGARNLDFNSLNESMRSREISQSMRFQSMDVTGLDLKKSVRSGIISFYDVTGLSLQGVENITGITFSNVDSAILNQAPNLTGAIITAQPSPASVGKLANLNVTGKSLLNTIIQSPQTVSGPSYPSGMRGTNLNGATTYQGMRYDGPLGGFNPNGKSLQGARFYAPPSAGNQDGNRGEITIPAQFVAATGVTPAAGTVWIDGSRPWG